MGNVVIVSAKRTPFGNFGGTLKDMTNVELGALAIKEVLGDLVPPEDIDQLIYGVVEPGSGLSPVRQIICAAEWPIDTNALCVERACCSSMSAIGLAYERIKAGRAKIIMAGGSETMSSTPYLLPQLRWGARLGDVTIKDELVIRNPYLNAPMALYAGQVGVEWGEGREQQDEWGVRSNRLAIQAQEKSLFNEEIFPVEVKQRKGSIVMEKDEHPRQDATMERLAKLSPIYGSPTVTAGNASALSDGASAVLIMDEDEAEKRGIKALARIVDWVSACSEPRNSPLLPAVASSKLLGSNDMSLEQMAVIEINEAFASMPLVSSRALCDNNLKDTKKLRERINVNGGAIAIGHPLGASGARITMAMMYELRRRKEQYGLAAICGAIGQGDAVILEAIY